MSMWLALDPGTFESGWCVLDGQRVVHSGVMRNEAMVQWLRDEEWLRPCTLAIEMVQGMGMAVGQEVFETVWWTRSEEQTSELQSLMRISYADLCWNKKI